MKLGEQFASDRTLCEPINFAEVESSMLRCAPAKPNLVESTKRKPAP
jgi:hypothetical protein